MDSMPLRRKVMQKFREMQKSDNKTDFGKMLPEKKGVAVEVVGKTPEAVKEGLEMAEEFLPESSDMQKKWDEEHEAEEEKQERNVDDIVQLENAKNRTGEMEQEDDIGDGMNGKHSILNNASEEELIDMLSVIHKKLGMK